jgi:hypothetical protein
MIGESPDMGLTFGRIGRHMKTTRLSAKIPYARFWWKNRPAHSCSAGHLGYKGKSKQMFDKAQFQNQNLNHNIKRKIRPPRTQSAGQLYHMELDLSSIIFSSNCTKKKCLPEEDTFLMIRPAPWVGLSSPTYHVWLWNAPQFPIHGRGRR